MKNLQIGDLNDIANALEKMADITPEVGGGTGDLKRVANALEKMSDGSGNATLPEVTSADNGKVLTVVEGEWNKAENRYVYEGVWDAEPTTIDGNDYDVLRFANGSNIIAKYLAGYPVLLKYPETAGPAHVYLTNTILTVTSSNRLYVLQKGEHLKDFWLENTDLVHYEIIDY